MQEVIDMSPFQLDCSKANGQGKYSKEGRRGRSRGGEKPRR